METENNTPNPHDTTREKIVESARREFGEFGLAGARVDRIADHAGINKAMIYYHFKSKEELYAFVIDEFQSRALALIRRDLSESFTFEEFLRVAVSRHASMFADQPDVKSIFIRELANPESEYLDRITNNIIGSGLPREVFIRLQEGMHTGIYRNFDPRQLMTAFMSMSIGFYLLEPVFNRMFPCDDRAKFIEDRKQIIVEIFLNGLRTKPA